jgi:hypothetical protein
VTLDAGKERIIGEHFQGSIAMLRRQLCAKEPSAFVDLRVKPVK